MMDYLQKSRDILDTVMRRVLHGEKDTAQIQTGLMTAQTEAMIAQAEALTRLADAAELHNKLIGQGKDQQYEMAIRIGKAAAGEFLAHIEQAERLMEVEAQP